MFPRELIGFVDPDDYFEYRGIILENGEFRHYNNFDELIDHIKNRRAAVGLDPLPAPLQTVENYLFRSKVVPQSLFTKDFQTNRALIPDINTGANLALSLSKQALTGVVGIGGGGWCSKKEANRRAKICSNCPNNVDLEKSLAIRARNKLANFFTPYRKTDYDDKLFDCGVCGCPNDQKVHYAEEVIREVTEDDASEFPASFRGVDNQNEKYQCWVRQILEKKKNV